MSQHEATEIAREAQRRLRLRPGMKIALPTAAALGAGAAIAVGSIGGGGTINGCYAGTTGAVVEDHSEPAGALRIIDPTLTINGTPNAVPNTAPKECQPGETQISWNQQGPAGPQGPGGPAGSTGAQGPAGASSGGETSFGLQNTAGLSYLKIDGITGESTDRRHKGDIQLESFSFGVSNRGSGGGGGAGKTSLQTFTITKPIDKASPLLFGAASSGKHLKYVELLFAHKHKGAQQDFLKLKFEDVIVDKLQDGTSPKGMPQEQVSFDYLKLRETFINGDGKVQGSVNVSLLSNKAF